MCIDRPLLALDRPFTYSLPEDLGGGVGSLVQVPFHGRAVRGWVLGPTEDVPARMLQVKKVVTSVRFFDEHMLELFGWIGERYVAPLASVIARSHPPRVASEEIGRVVSGPTPLREPGASSDGAPFAGYTNGTTLLEALPRGRGSFLLRPAPEDEVALAVGCVGATLSGGRTAIVLVPEAEPVPATASALVEAFGERVRLFLGGDRRERYRGWLGIGRSRSACVVGTRPTVFAPVGDLGLIYVCRESHPAHREDRSPYYHVRDVALARARLAGAVCVMASVCPSLEASAVAAVPVAPRSRRWPPVEVVRPGPEGRSPRLVAALRSARRGFLYAPLPGYGVAKVCRSCGEPAACSACGGLLRAEGGVVRCAVCGADGTCGSCGGRDFGLRRGGAERVEEWAARLAPVPVRRLMDGDRPPSPGREEVVVGGPGSVGDRGPLDLELVGILDADLAARRPGLAASERALVTWMEAASWARPRGRVIVQSSRRGDPAVQALVRGNPDRFHRTEATRRKQAGFPVGFPTFRVAGTAELLPELEALSPATLLISGHEDLRLCLLTLEPAALEAFSRLARDLAERGILTRVEAEPHL